MIPTCPKCGLPANDIDLVTSMTSEFDPCPASEVNILGHCDNGHAFFTAIRFDGAGRITDSVSGLSGTRSPWAKEGA